MDSFEINKFVGAVLATVLLLMGLNIVGGALFDAGKPDAPGYVIEVAGAATPEASGGESEAASADGEGSVSLAARIAAADLAKGEKVFKKCQSCHTADNGGASKAGPNLWDIVNREIATMSGYKYSAALTEFGSDKTWTYAHLDGFLTKPTDYVKKTKMALTLKKPEDRAAVIAYLRTLSDNPAPLPAE